MWVRGSPGLGLRMATAAGRQPQEGGPEGRPQVPSGPAGLARVATRRGVQSPLSPSGGRLPGACAEWCLPLYEAALCLLGKCIVGQFIVF